MDIRDALTWLLATSGPPLIVLTLLGYVFREKWKQILARSLESDLARLKADLAKDAAIHAASLAPQLESIKTDFQQKLEAYKVSLIASAERAKAEADVRKAVALKYVGIEFDRLISLEKELGAINADVVSMGRYDVAYRDVAQWKEYLERKRQLDVACDECSMFLDATFAVRLAKWRRDLVVRWGVCWPSEA